MSEEMLFMTRPPEWLKNVKDDRVASATFALILDHNLTGELFAEERLKKEIAEFDDLSKSQAQQVFDLIVSHKDPE